MRQVYAVLRLQWGQGRSERKIAQSLGLSRPAVAAYVRRAQAAEFIVALTRALRCGSPRAVRSISQSL
jgi:predicted transcriptional regulator